ncbi:MAG: hypothetical protein DI597_18445 [Pseudoxanthomonas spadix]|nr:MAG: hypothetical protein DI597_18445 [Pseudoxanthomonas spadix]
MRVEQRVAVPLRRNGDGELVAAELAAQQQAAVRARHGADFGRAKRGGMRGQGSLRAGQPGWRLGRGGCGGIHRGGRGRDGLVRDTAGGYQCHGQQRHGHAARTPCDRIHAEPPSNDRPSVWPCRGLPPWTCRDPLPARGHGQDRPGQGPCAAQHDPARAIRQLGGDRSASLPSAGAPR